MIPISTEGLPVPCPTQGNGDCGQSWGLWLLSRSLLRPYRACMRILCAEGWELSPTDRQNLNDAHRWLAALVSETYFCDFSLYGVLRYALAGIEPHQFKDLHPSAHLWKHLLPTTALMDLVSVSICIQNIPISCANRRLILLTSRLRLQMSFWLQSFSVSHLMGIGEPLYSVLENPRVVD